MKLSLSLLVVALPRQFSHVWAQHDAGDHHEHAALRGFSGDAPFGDPQRWLTGNVEMCSPPPSQTVVVKPGEVENRLGQGYSLGPCCISEGESGIWGSESPPCCTGTTPVYCLLLDQNNGSCHPCTEPPEATFVCANCGDSICGPGENKCSCPEDCVDETVECVPEGETAPFDLVKFPCCEGTVPAGCDAPDAATGECIPCIGSYVCTKCGDGICGPGENKCNCPDCFEQPTECVPEGGSVAVLPDAPPCCEGTAPISCQAPDTSDACPSVPCTGSSICAKCGDGTCGPGENKCNCPADCGEAECVPEGESGSFPDECCSGLAPVICTTVDATSGQCQACPTPDTIVCTRCGDGTCGPGEHRCNCPDCCEGLGECTPDGESLDLCSPGCCSFQSGYYTIGCESPDPVTDECDYSCNYRFGLAPALCAKCGDGECGPGENKCNCPEDCCTEQEQTCTPEGMTFKICATKCCGDLISLSSEPPPDASGACLPFSGPGPLTIVCSKCYDGICGPGENQCNCPEDCCPLPRCIEEGETGAAYGRCFPNCCDGLSTRNCYDTPIDASKTCGLPIRCSPDHPDPQLSVICTNCGDGDCGTGENVCNCPQDCCEPQDCIPTGEYLPQQVGLCPASCCPGSYAMTCPSQDVPGGCDGTCAVCWPEGACGDGTCEDPENECNCPDDCCAQGCVPAGEYLSQLGPCYPSCCPGSYAMPCPSQNAPGECDDTCAVCWLEGACGDGTCEDPENECNCPIDCGGAECVPVGKTGVYGPYGPDPGCCPGLSDRPCFEDPGDSPTCGPPVRCSPEHSDPYTSFVCINCGDGSCGVDENKCNCPDDCCEPQDCIPTGEYLTQQVGPCPASCCPGSYPMPCPSQDVPGECDSSCAVCWPEGVCGDGTCEDPENECNCYQDCFPTGHADMGHEQQAHAP